MKTQYGIPIRNIYCMLCYYSDFKPLDFQESFGDEDFEDIYSLMSVLLDNSIKPILRRGMYREYREVGDLLTIPKGKINFEDTIREYARNSRSVHCEHDVFTPDNVYNRIIRSTLEYLIGYDRLAEEVSDALELDLARMQSVSSVRITRGMFDSVRMNGNNHHYALPLNICRLVFDMKVMNESDGGNYPNFSLDDALSRIYEKFIFNYCKINFPEYTVKNDKLEWALTVESDRTDLPHMNTDVSIYDDRNRRKLILDAKFYAKMMSGRFEEHETLRNGHLYQIYSYINNDDYAGEVSGALIYPQVSNGPYFRRYDFRNGRDISVMTINLDSEWSEIENTLDSIFS